MAQPNKPAWWKQTEDDLFRYLRSQLSIRRGMLAIADLQEEMKHGRRITPSWYGEAVYSDDYSGRWGYAGEDRSGPTGQAHSSEQQEETLVLRLMEYEERLNQLLAYTKLIEAAIDLEFGGMKWERRFIHCYWLSGRDRSTARKLVLKEVPFITDETFRDWKRDIITKLAQSLGHLDRIPQN